MESPKNVSVITLRYWKKIEVPTPEPTLEKEVDPAASNRKRDKHAIGPSTSSERSCHQPPIALPIPPKPIPSKIMEEVHKEIPSGKWR